MSHFTVLVSTQTPPLPTLSKELETEWLAEIKRLNQKIEEEPDNLKHRIALSDYYHRTDFGIENVVESSVDEILAPYDENTEDDKYLE